MPGWLMPGWRKAPLTSGAGAASDFVRGEALNADAHVRVSASLTFVTNRIGEDLSVLTQSVEFVRCVWWRGTSENAYPQLRFRGSVGPAVQFQ